MEVSWRRIAAYAAAALAGSALVALALRPAPVWVETESVSRGPLAVTLEEEGRTRVADRYVLSAPVAARARRIRPEPGDRVAAGEVLAVLDPAASPVLDRRAREQAEARLRAAEAALRSARE
ncbi:efflux transporter periplasmic adaptor subunit, partial [Halorhodospira neutriphila]|nr:efflux transporter periplasmic adaptor subunit [Halorhodospira neutriphila]